MVVFEARGHEMCTFGLSFCRVRAPAATEKKERANFDFDQLDFGQLAEVELSEVELAEVEHLMRCSLIHRCHPSRSLC